MKKTKKDLENLVIEAKNCSDPGRLSQIWKETTSTRVRKEVITNPRLPPNFFRDKAVIKTMGDLFLENDAFDLSTLFNSSSFGFSEKFISALKIIRDLKENRITLNSLAPGYGADKFYADIYARSLIKVFIKTALTLPNIPIEEKTEFLNVLFNSNTYAARIRMSRIAREVLKSKSVSRPLISYLQQSCRLKVDEFLDNQTDSINDLIKLVNFRIVT